MTGEKYIIILLDDSLDPKRIKDAIDVSCQPKTVINKLQEKLINTLGEILRTADCKDIKPRVKVMAQVVNTFFEITNLRNPEKYLMESTIETKLYNAAKPDDIEDTELATKAES